MDIHSANMQELLGKPAQQFTLEDILSFIRDNGIRMVNFMYPASDGRLKTLNFVIGSEGYLRTILTSGERVDGSSLFPFIGAGNSDLYVIPRLRTAFVDPFGEIPAVSFLCSFFDKDGNRLECSPEYTLYKAKRAFAESTGMEFQAMGELEFYISAREDERSLMYPASDQKGYHESEPFAKFNSFRQQCMFLIMLAGGRIKYGHSEVGNFRMDGRIYEQNEIEFLPVDVEEAADTLMLAKWIIRNLAYRSGLDVSFAPKITTGKAGSGLHIHMRIMKEGRNMMLDDCGVLSVTARKMIAGMMELAPSITAFGNCNPTSYFRLVPHQEAPTSICWGDRNRSVLVRVPLGWTSGKDMFSQLNTCTQETDRNECPDCEDTGISGRIVRNSAGTSDSGSRQTVEIRSADCSADVYLLLASLCVACRHGLEMPDALAVADRTYVDVNIHNEENRARLESLDQLPDSCTASASRLESVRSVYERDGIFSPVLIDGILDMLRSYGDADIRNRLSMNPALMDELVRKYYYCG